MKYLASCLLLMIVCIGNMYAVKPNQLTKSSAHTDMTVKSAQSQEDGTAAGGKTNFSGVIDMCDVEVKVPFDNGLTAEKRQEVIEHLTKILSDEFVLYVKIAKYHWNVRGPFFGPLHAFFQSLYEQAFNDADLVAERIRALGGLSIGTMKEFLEFTRLVEVPGRNPVDAEMIGDLLLDFQTIIKHLRNDIEKLDKLDPVTGNMLMTMVEKHEKTAWMLRSHLECLHTK